MSQVIRHAGFEAGLLASLRELGLPGLRAIRRLRAANAPIPAWVAECRRLHGVTEEDGSGRLATVDAHGVVRDVRVA